MNGFSFIEVLISVVVLVLVSLAIFVVLNVGEGAFNSDNGLLDVLESARRTSDLIAAEARQSSSLEINGDGTRVTVSVPVDITTSPITYSQDISYYRDENERMLIREHPPGTSQPVAGNIEELTFCCWKSGTCGTDCSGSKVLEISVQAGKTVRQRHLQYGLKQRVRLRN